LATIFKKNYHRSQIRPVDGRDAIFFSEFRGFDPNLADALKNVQVPIIPAAAVFIST
jgi:hypothetical protein